MSPSVPSEVARVISCNRGSASVEFAAIGTLLVGLTVGVFDLGRLALNSYRMGDAASNATRLIEMGGTDAQVEAGARAAFPVNEREQLVVGFDLLPLNGVNYRVVELRFRLPLIVPNLGLFDTEGGDVILTERHLVALN